MKKLVFASITALVLASALMPVSAQDQPSQPNFVVITIDDMQWQTFGYLDPTYARFTPFLTAYANESVSFLNSYVPYSLCTPTRASLMSGLVPHRNGVVDHYRSIFTGVRTLPDALKTAGYFNGLVGKVRHTLVERLGTVDFIVGPDQLKMGRSPERYHAETLRFLAAANGEPFFLNINIHDPHTPYPGDDSADRWKSYVQFLTDRSGLSSLLGSARLQYQGTPPAEPVQYKTTEVPLYPFLPDVPAARVEMTQILTAARRADRSVEAIIAALDEANVASNTVVFIFSDNGAALPFSKDSTYLNSLRAGLIVHVPWLPKSTDYNTTSLVSINDIYPTVLDMAKVAYDKRSIDGKSLVSLLEERQDDPMFRQYLAGYYFRDFPQRSITDGKMWYVWNPWVDGRTQARGHFLSSKTFAAMKQSDDERYRFLMYRTPEELYDVTNDPNSQRNLADKPEFKGMLMQMRRALLEDMERTLDPMLDEFELLIQSEAGASDQ